ncbi:glycosyltransferase family 2 protein [Mycobacterium sp. 94-17]|uniref:glycosyltransferase family 2 protein n=1 Tax=Mycobacterium sp. 94-17 TaxID=2986147 RepID=UPI002D1ED2E7|nr:glycosyltransferase family 2 protein [Mycobacterium sp. 94-17]MEB4210083.1 glycosyltransferase family 2 protein [Mycobacterium sp. 94-17]
MTALSIIMPVYNEAATIVRAINRVLAVDYPCPVELIIVDDGSTDGTVQLLAPFTDWGVTLVGHPTNRGKGAAVITGVQKATGTHVMILDADLEYSPSDIPNLLQPVVNGIADHVFGSRIFGLNTRFPSYRLAIGGRFLTAVANVLFDSCLTDMHTCLKLIPLQHFRALMLSQNGFGLDTELTAKILRAGIRPYEVPVTYYGRTSQEGKKLSWQRDGWVCLWLLLMTRLRKPEKLPVTTVETISVVVPMPAASAPPLRDKLSGQIVNAVT